MLSIAVRTLASASSDCTNDSVVQHAVNYILAQPDGEMILPALRLT